MLYLLFTGLIVAAFAAVCTYCVQWRLAKLARQWDEKCHVVKTAERFCDELMALAIAYWSEKFIGKDEDDVDARLLEYKIAAHNQLLRKFLSENFANNYDMPARLWKVEESIHGDNFGTTSRETYAERVALSVAAIVNLRLTISRTILKR